MAAGKKSIRIGIAGLGRIGLVHLNHLLYMPQAALVSVCDPLIHKKKSLVKEGIVQYSDYSEMLKNEQLQAIVICTPTPLHFDMIEEAFSYGIHVFCEKPLDPELHNIKRIHQFAQKSKLNIQVGFNRRFDRNFSSAQNTIMAGDIGDVHLLKITSRDPAPPSLAYLKSSGGLFMDMSIHDFDMARFLMGSEVTEVYAIGSVMIDKVFHKVQDIDTAIIQLQFENGAMGVIDNSRQAVYGYDQRAEVLGSKGMVQVQNPLPQSNLVANDLGSHQSRPYQFFMDRYADSFRVEIELFIKSILDHHPTAVDAHDAYMATAIAIAAKESLLQNRPISVEQIAN
jgi:myo-inositol 2-dehydrogenase / D-chiro-inositol 1-dehydrogenase